MDKSNWLKRYKGYFQNLLLIWFAIFIYRNLPFYQGFIEKPTQAALIYLALAYTIFGFIFYFSKKMEQIKPSKGELIFSALRKTLSRNPLKKAAEEKKISKPEKVALLFGLVKLFFLPVMINFVFSNFFSFISQTTRIDDLSMLFSIQAFNLIVFPLILTIFFFIDTAWYAFGYAFESSVLENQVRSVEPTFFGWFVALACYPPFNGYVTKYVGWYANDYAFIFNDTITFITRIFVIILIGIYVSASLALGAKCSNLTNRGIVSRGPYAIIRHPAYISKNTAWWLTIIPVISIPAVLSMGAWSMIYHLRTLTEERHLRQDPDYVEYCKKVKYKYIPGIY